MYLLHIPNIWKHRKESTYQVYKLLSQGLKYPPPNTITTSTSTVSHSKSGVSLQRKVEGRFKQQQIQEIFHLTLPVLGLKVYLYSSKFSSKLWKKCISVEYLHFSLCWFESYMLTVLLPYTFVTHSQTSSFL